MKRKELLLAGLLAPIVLRDRVSQAARLGGGPLALVTADLESHVIALTIGPDEVEKRIRTEPGPRSIESWLQSLAIVAHTQQGLVSIVDGVELRVLHVVEGFEQPRYTATGGANVVYVTDSAHEAVVVLNPYEGRIVRRVAVPGPARHLSLSPDGSRLWVALGSKAERIAILDVREAERPRLLGVVAPPFRAHDVVFAPDGRTVWVTSGSTSKLAVYGVDGREQSVIADVGAAPQHVFFSGSRALVGSGDDGRMRLFRADGALVRSSRIPLGSYNVTGGFGHVVTPSLTRGTVCLMSAGGAPRATKRVAKSAHDACVVFSG